jgi:hypothetical protein
MSVAKREGLDLGPDFYDTRSADKNHLQRRAGEGGGEGFDAGVNLAAIGVSFDDGVEEAEAALGGVADFAGEENGSGAGAEDRFLRAELAQCLKEVALVEELEHSCGLAAGEDEGGNGGQLLGLADFRGLGAGLGEGEGVGGVVALDGEDADAGMQALAPGRGFAGVFRRFLGSCALDEAPAGLAARGGKVIAKLGAFWIERGVDERLPIVFRLVHSIPDSRQQSHMCRSSIFYLFRGACDGRREPEPDENRNAVRSAGARYRGIRILAGENEAAGESIAQMTVEVSGLMETHTDAAPSFAASPIATLAVNTANDVFTSGSMVTWQNGNTGTFDMTGQSLSDFENFLTDGFFTWSYNDGELSINSAPYPRPITTSSPITDTTPGAPTSISLTPGTSPFYNTGISGTVTDSATGGGTGSTAITADATGGSDSGGGAGGWSAFVTFARGATADPSPSLRSGSG